MLCRTVDCTCTGSLLQWFPELVLDNIDPQRIHEDDHYLLWCGKCLGLGHRWDEYSHSRLSEWIYLCIISRSRRIADHFTSTIKTTLHKMYSSLYLYAVMMVMSLNQPKTATIAYIAIAPKMMQATTDLLKCSDNWGAIINIQDLIFLSQFLMLAYLRMACLAEAANSIVSFQSDPKKPCEVFFSRRLWRACNSVVNPPCDMHYTWCMFRLRKAPCGDRTHDRTLTKRMLCQLS